MRFNFVCDCGTSYNYSGCGIFCVLCGKDMIPVDSNATRCSMYIKAAIAVLTQNKTYPADIEYAKSCLANALSEITNG